MVKKIITVRNIGLIHITLLILFCSVGVCLTGCCSSYVLSSKFGASNSYFDSPKYELSPDRDEIILTSSRITTRSSLGLQSRSTWKERIPLDPLPENLMCCRLTVEQDPDGQKYWHDTAENMIPNDRFDIEVESLPLQADETLRLRVLPKDMYLLSQPFRVRLIPKNGTGEAPADTDGQAGTPAPVKPAPGDRLWRIPQPQAGTPVPAKPAGELRLMIPVSRSLDGRSYELLTVAPADPRPNPYREWLGELERIYREEYKAREAKRGKIPSYFDFCRVILSSVGGSTYDPYDQRHEMLYQAAKEWDQREELRYYYPFLEGQEEARMIEYERLMGDRFPSFEATLWKTVMLPPAFVLDVAFLPATVPMSFYYYLGYMAVGASIQ